MTVWLSLSVYAVTYTTIIIIQNSLRKKQSRRLSKALAAMQTRIQAQKGAKQALRANTLSERVALLSLNRFDGICVNMNNGLVLRIFIAGVVDLLALGRIKLTSVDDSNSDHGKVLLSVLDDSSATGSTSLSWLLIKLRERQKKAGGAPIDLQKWLYSVLQTGSVMTLFARTVFGSLATQQQLVAKGKTYDVFKQHMIYKRTELGVAVTDAARDHVRRHTNVADGIGSDGDLLARLVLSTYGSQSSTRKLYRQIYPLGGNKPKPFPCTLTQN